MANIPSLGRLFLRNRRCKALHSWEICLFSSQPTGKEPPLKTSFQQPPLSEPLPGLAKPVYASHKGGEEVTRITTLSNGLRVASENRFGQFCTIGVIVDSGPRYEVAYPSGISHFLEKLAFSSSTEFGDRDKILMALEKHGGICDCLSARDTFVYASSADRRGLDAVVRILGEVILRPQITAEEVDVARQHIKYELETLMTRPEQETILLDMVHAAAYRDNTLGLPKICPEENLRKIDRNLIFSYLKNHYTPERMVVAGVGIEHEQLVESVQKHFVEKDPIWKDNTGSSKHLGKVDNSIAQYTGGLVKEECQIPLHMGPSGLPELAHVVIGLEGCSHQDPDFIAMCVLSVIMGGGGSFSAGGPGKGMYTRLYTNVLNRYHWMFSATAYNQAYADTGIFYIHASAPPKYVRDITDVLTREMNKMTTPVIDSELKVPNMFLHGRWHIAKTCSEPQTLSSRQPTLRAKVQLQSMILMNLEARPVMFEDIGRQVLATGQRKLPSTFIQDIENITSSDIERAAARLLRSQPSVAARGDIRKLPDLAQIQSSLSGKEGKFQGKGRLSLFT